MKPPDVVDEKPSAVVAFSARLAPAGMLARTLLANDLGARVHAGAAK